MHKARQQSTEIAVIDRGEARYPEAVMRLLGESAPERIWAMGNLDLLARPLLALFCSSKCPGSVILQTYDTVCTLRDTGAAVIGGFHSPIEKECLRLLLRGAQPIVICPARSIERMRVPTEWRAPLTAGRVLILSPFDAKHRRITADTAQYRNRFAAALADRVLVPHAESGGSTAALLATLSAWGKPLMSLDDASSSLPGSLRA